MATRLRTVIPVWVAAVVAALLIGLLSPAPERLTWLPIAMAALVLATFALQIAIPQKEGLVDRMMASLGGGILILAVATPVLLLVP